LAAGKSMAQSALSETNVTQIIKLEKIKKKIYHNFYHNSNGDERV
jgi:hypothetical protein